MTRHKYFRHDGNQPLPSPPPQFGMSTLLGDGNEQYSSYYDGAEMRPSYSHRSMGSAPWDNSPGSYDNSFLNNYPFSQGELGVSPILPSMHFETMAYNGAWATDGTMAHDLPTTLPEYDGTYEDSMNWNGSTEPSFTVETIFPDDFDSTNDYQAPPNVAQGASTSGRSGYRCTFEACTSEIEFSRKTDLDRHVRSVHGKKRFDCEFPWCGRYGEHGFVRRDHYLEHLRQMHGKPIPKISRKQESK